MCETRIIIIINNKVLNKIKIAVRILSQKGIYKYNKNMINVWGNYGIISFNLENYAAYINKLTGK